MAKLRSRNDPWKKAQLQTTNIVPFGTQVALRTRMGGLRGGYINRLNRNQKKGVPQLKGIPGCGNNLKDWLLDEER